MDWQDARERLGAGLIGARTRMADRWLRDLRESGHVPHSLAPLAAELLLQAAAALADGAPPHTPWTRCGGTLRVDARGGERALETELTALFRVLREQLALLAFSEAEQRRGEDELSLQLEAALRGARAEVRALLDGEPVDDDALRFGGVKVLVFRNDARAA